MKPTIRLTVISGPHKNMRFCLRGKTHCKIGRGSQCDFQLNGADRDGLISRRHCRLDIDGPCIQVTDHNSANGTYINGQRIEPEDDSSLNWLAFLEKNALQENLGDGDMLTVGNTTLRVNVMDCPIQSESAVEKDLDGKSVFPIRNCPQPC